MVDLFGAASDTRGFAVGDVEAPSDFVVLDGRWLHNIPLRRALDGIALARPRPTERVLIHVQPGTPKASDGDPDRLSTQRRSVVNVRQGMVGAFWTGETIAADIGALEEHNRAVARTRVTF